MTRLSNGNQVIAALAIDQRGALKRLLAAAAGGGDFANDILVDFKKVISSEPTPYARFVSSFSRKVSQSPRSIS